MLEKKKAEASFGAPNAFLCPLPPIGHPKKCFVAAIRRASLAGRQLAEALGGGGGRREEVGRARQQWESAGQRALVGRKNALGVTSCSNPTPRGFEPLRAEPNGFRVYHLSHSVTVSWQGRLFLSLCKRMLSESAGALAGSEICAKGGGLSSASNPAGGTSPELIAARNLIPRGLEPRTSRPSAVRSNQLSYETCWVWQETHQKPILLFPQRA